MLTAIDREKTKFYLRYKGVRGSFDKGRITAEDEVTSLFGVLSDEIFAGM
ncbi:hypothetical protein [Rhodanobacter lindaniclasticus]